MRYTICTTIGNADEQRLSIGQGFDLPYTPSAGANHSAPWTATISP